MTFRGADVSGRVAIALWCGWLALGVNAAEVKIFRTDSQEAVLAGTLEGLSVDPDGHVTLARQFERLAMIEEPFVFTAAAHPKGWVVGTGNSGKVLMVDRKGEVSEVLTAEEPEVFAVWAAADGTVFAGTSPQGKVYRVHGDLENGAEAEVVFEAEDSYIWDLEQDAKGRLLVATGLKGRLYRIDAKGNSEMLFESRDAHVRSIASLPDGGVLLGTAGQGLIVRLDADGTAKTLHDAAHPEVLSVVAAENGTAYAAVLASEASFVDLSAKSSGSTASTADEAATTATVVDPTQDTVGSRSSSFSGPRSVILEISPNGKVAEVASFQSETVHALLWQDGELWIGTGQEGKIYRWSDRRLMQETMLEERQIAALVSGPAGAAAVTANASALYRLHDDVEAAGTYVSAVLDSTQVARYGSFLWNGALPRGAAVNLDFRSGMSATPDATWTDWTTGGEARCIACAGGAGRGQEVALGDIAHGRYVQWRAQLERGSDDAPQLKSVELSYRQENLAPEIETLEVLDPGEILVPTSFNPQNQTFEPWSPNRDGIFTTLRLETPKNGSGGSKKSLWKKGYRTLRWGAKDANEDELWYRLEFRLADSEHAWLPMVAEITDDHYGFDATVLPDGLYRFRLTASDAQARLPEEALTDHKLSESVVIDHTPPMLAARNRRGATLELELEDALSPMRSVAVSSDATEWRPVAAADGLLDGRRERLQIEVPADAQLLLLRVSDAAHNVVTFNLLGANN